MNNEAGSNSLPNKNSTTPFVSLKSDFGDNASIENISYSDVISAADRIRGVVHRTPILTSSQANQRTGAILNFKCENFQRSGAFKFRGAYNALACLDEERRRRGVVTFSSGNHGQAIALAAKLLQMTATIVMPHDAPVAKVSAVRHYGAEIVLYRRGEEDREVIAKGLSEFSGAAFIPPYNHVDVVAGQGTVAQELFDEVGPLDYLFVCIGGGSLISGSAIVAKQLSPACKVIGVEPTEGNDAQIAMRLRRPIKIAVPKTIADGARTQQIGQLEFHIMQKNISTIVTVNDHQLRKQMSFFAERMKILVEPTGCLAAAAAMNDLIDIAGSRVGIIVSGGNVDMSTFCGCVSA